MVQVPLDIPIRVTGANIASRALDRINRSSDRAERSITRTDRSVRRVNTSFNGLNRVLGLVSVATAGLAFRGAVRQASNFETAIAEIATIVDTTTTSIDTLSDAVQRQSRLFGQDQTTQARALYNIISAGATDAGSAIALLNASNRLAEAGITDVATASRVLSGTLNAYALDASEVTDISDTLFTVVRLGTTTMGQLAHSIGTVTPLASALGIPMDVLGASFATLTTSIGSTNRSATAYLGILRAILRPTAQATEFAEMLGIAFSAEGLREAGGFPEFLELIRERTGGTTEALGMLFTDTEGLAGALILTGAGAETLSDNLEAMESRMGATAMASQVIADTFNNQFNRAVQTGSVVVTNFGERIQNRLLPFVRRINEDLPSVIRDITRLGGALLIAFAPSILGRIFSVGLAIRTALLLNPIGALITAISLLVGAFIALPEDSIPALDQFRDSTIDRFEAIGLSAQNLGNVINNALIVPQLSIQGLEMLLGLYIENREGINESIQESVLATAGSLESSTLSARDFAMNLESNIMGVTESITTPISDFFNSIIDGFESLGESDITDAMRLNQEQIEEIRLENPLRASIIELNNAIADAGSNVISGILSPFMLVDDTVQSVQQNVRSVASSLRGLPQDFNLITMQEFEQLVMDFPTTGELFDLLDRNIPQENRVFEIQGLIPPINIDNFLEAREDKQRSATL